MVIAYERCISRNIMLKTLLYTRSDDRIDIPGVQLGVPQARWIFDGRVN